MIDKIQIICNDFRESLNSMPYESVGRLFMALMAFANDEDPNPCIEDDMLAKTLFPVIKQHIIRNEEYRQLQSNLGKKGGAPKGNKNACKKQPKTTENNPKQAPNLTLPNLTNINIKSVCKPNQFTEGAKGQQYDFPLLEEKLIKN